MRRGAAVAEHELDRQRSAARAGKERELRLADLKAHPHRIEGHDRGQWLGRRLRHETADLEQAVADAAADRRADRRVFHIQLGGPQNGAVRFEHRLARGDGGVGRLTRRERVVEILARRRVLVDQRRQTIDVLARLQKRRLGLRDVGRRLGKGSTRALGFRFVQASGREHQHLSGSHVRSDGERAALDVPVDAAADFDQIARVSPRGVCRGRWRRLRPRGAGC